MELSDEVLCRRAAEHDEAAFDALVARYQARAYRLAWSIVRNAEDARDVSQEAFIRLYQSAGKFDGRSKFSTWFYRTLVNLWNPADSIAIWKHRWWTLWTRDESDPESEESLLDRQPAPAQNPVDAIGRERTLKRLWEAVGRLAPQQQAAVILQVQEELPTREIAAVLKCSEATVRVHLHRAVSTLRKTLKTTETD